MKWIPSGVLIYLIVGQFSAAGQNVTLYDYNFVRRLVCSSLFGNLTTTHRDLCLEISKDYDKDLQSKYTRDYHTQVISRYNQFISNFAILKSRVKKSGINSTIAVLQKLDHLEVTGSGHSFMVDTDDGIDIDDKLNLDSTSISINLTNYAALDETLNGTEFLNETLEKVKPIVSNEIVWVNQSVTINGSCCMIANISLAPGQQLFTTDLIIIKDSDGAYLDGTFTWGFIHRKESPETVTDVVTFIQTVNASNSSLFASSYQLDDKVILDEEHWPLTIYGNVSFSHLDLKTGKVDQDPEHPSLFKSLFLIQVPNGDPIDLCLLNFNKVKFTSLIDPQIGNVNLLSLLTYDTDQSVNSSIQLTEIQLDGSVLSSEHQFAHKLSHKLSTIVNSSSYLHYDNLILKSINVTNLTTDGWNDWLLAGSNETLNLGQVIINGPVTLSDRVNDLRWDHDLIRIDGTEIMDQIVVVYLGS